MSGCGTALRLLKSSFEMVLPVFLLDTKASFARCLHKPRPECLSLNTSLETGFLSKLITCESVRR